MLRIRHPRLLPTCDTTDGGRECLVTVSQECEAAVRARAVLAALSPSDTSQRHIDPMQSCGHFTQTRFGPALDNSDLILGYTSKL